MSELRFGVLNYLNCLPATLGLELGETGGESWSLHRGNPAELNALMRAGELDVSLVSTAEYLEQEQLYRRLSGISLWCKGPVESVAVFSPHSREELLSQDAPLIAVTPESATSVALTQLLVPGCRTAPFANLEECRGPLAEGTYQGILLIGDRALAPPVWMNRLMAHDLCQWWTDNTGHPMTFAVWVARADLPDQHLKEAEELLHSSLTWGRGNWERVLETGCRRSGLDRARLDRYLKGIQFSTTPDSEKGFQEYRTCLKKSWVRNAGKKLNRVAGAPPLKVTAL